MWLEIARDAAGLGYVLITRLQVDVLVGNAVKAGTGVHKDARNLIAAPATLAGKHPAGLPATLVGCPRVCSAEKCCERVFGRNLESFVG